MSENITSFSDTRARLEEIASKVDDENISLDEALSLYEEAVMLGLQACELSELDLMEDSPTDSDDSLATAEAVDVPGSSELDDVAEKLEPTVAPESIDTVETLDEQPGIGQ